MAKLFYRAGLAGLLMCGRSAQSVPTVESITKPTLETFAQLASWRPWAQQEKQPAPIVLSDASPEPPKPTITPTLETETRPALKPAPIVISATKPAAARAPRVVPAAMAEEPTKSVPALVSCRTQNETGQRVRMECIPVD